jgi:hypothetical protein
MAHVEAHPDLVEQRPDRDEADAQVEADGDDRRQDEQPPALPRGARGTRRAQVASPPIT